MKDYFEFTRDRLGSAFRIVTCLLIDFGIFLCWLLCAWQAHRASVLVQSHDVSINFALAFEYVSSFATFLMTCVYVLHDFRKSCAECFEKLNDFKKPG